MPIYKLDKIPGRGKIHPFALVREHLATLKDELIEPTTTELSFVADQDLREALRLDVAGATRSFEVADWKGCTVLAGSVVEALLLCELRRREETQPGEIPTVCQRLVASKVLRKPPPADLDCWNLTQLTEVAHKLQLRKQNSFHSSVRGQISGVLEEVILAARWPGDFKRSSTGNAVS